ncbi:MAG: MFS transporter [Candidatus Firestonebacteria bacterium]
MERKHRIFVLTVAFFMSMCFGAGYAWSVFAQELHTGFAFSMKDAQLVFAIFQVAFAAGFLAGGRLIKKTGPRVLAFLGGIIMGAGFFISGLFEPAPMILMAGVGMLGGGGAGLAYIGPLETVQRCFPDKKALATGFSVGGLGIGSLLLAVGVDHLLRNGMHISLVFKIAGVLVIIIICGLSFFLRAPEAGTYEKKIQPLKYKEIFSSSNFWALFSAMLVSLFAGLMVIGNMKSLGMKWGVAGMYATIGVSVLAFFNSGGRILWGLIIHKIGEIKSIYLSILLQAAVIFFAVFFVRNSALFFIFAMLAGLNYGCALVVYASSVSRYFGVERLGQIYPLLFAGNFISGLIAPPFAGYIFDRTGSYDYALFSASGILIGGLILFSILFKNPDAAENPARP